ncbi:MAG: hypothetical protein AAGU27_16205 [Dehalobacterium sp.]
MRCPKCGKEFDPNIQVLPDDICEHCGFYFYLAMLLNVACYAIIAIDKNEEMYFTNIHKRIYNPFIIKHLRDVDPIRGAISIGEYLIAQLKEVIKGYPREDLLLTCASLRELATWMVFLPNPWDSVRLRTVCHVFTNLLNSFPNEIFDDLAIDSLEDLISAFVLVEEIEKIISNVFNTRCFQMAPTLYDIVKERIVNEEISDYFQQLEVKDMEKPEEIEFNCMGLTNYLYQRGMTVVQIKSDLNKELTRLFGFSIYDLNDFRDRLIAIAEENNQIIKIFQYNNETSLKVMFAFKEQFEEVYCDKLTAIINKLGYYPSYSTGQTYDKLADPYMDYKFIFEFDNILAIGLLDSANSITMFENIISSDHFVQDIFGEGATKIFKKAQQKIATLMAIKIALRYVGKDNWYVPMLNEYVPYVNVKNIQGHGVRLKILSSQNQDLGDIDLIVLDRINHKFIIYEIKYYKPTMNIRQLITKDKKILEDIEKIKTREQWFNDNIREITIAWGLEQANYSVETVVVTARPNYYGTRLEEYGVRYMTYHSALNG